MNDYVLTEADKQTINMRQRAHELVFPFKGPDHNDLTRASLTLGYAAAEIDRLRGVLADTAEIFNKLQMHDQAGRIDAALAKGNGQEGGV